MKNINNKFTSTSYIQRYFSTQEHIYHEMNKLSDWDEYMESNVPVIILAGAKWCGPCNFLKPMLINVSMEFHDKVKFVSMEIDKFPEIAELLEI